MGNTAEYFGAGLLLPFQRRWAEDRSLAKIWEASRQIGKTFALTLDAVIETSQSNRPIESVYGSASARQVYKAGREMRKHIRVLKVATDQILTSEKENTEMIVFPPGDRILNLVPSNPDTTAGFSGNVYLDEFALHKDSYSIWKAIFPSITRGYRLRIASTHRGKKTKFYELTRNPKYSLHKTTITDAVADGLDLRDEDGNLITPDDLRALLGDEETWLEEYMVDPQDETTAWLTHAMLFAVEDENIDSAPAWTEKLVERAGEAHRQYKRHRAEPDWWESEARQITAPLAEIGEPLDLGMDIGREKDLSVIWLLARKELAKKTVVVIELKKAPFYVQEKILWALLPYVRTQGRACIDRSGIGRQLAENARDRFGSKVEEVNFTNENKETLAVGLRDALEDHGILIPKDDAIHTSLHSVKKTTTATGLNRFDAARTDRTGHADHFWALALAEHAGSSNVAAPQIYSLAAILREEAEAARVKGEHGAIKVRLAEQGA